MPILENPHQYLIDSALDRASLFLTEDRTDLPEPEPDRPGFGTTFAAAGRTQNIIGSFVTNRVSRIMAGVSPFNGHPESFERDYDPAVMLQDDDFYRRNPWAIQGYDQLAGARSQLEFDTINETLRQSAEDHQTIAEAGTGSALVASLAVNVADPINLIPLGRIARTAKGIGTEKLLSNVAGNALAAGSANLVQEELLGHIQPGRPVDQLDADLAAFGIGAVLGGTLTFLTAPNFRAARSGDTLRVPTRKINDVQKAVQQAFDTERPDAGGTPRNVVDALEESEQALRRMIDEPAKDDAAVPVLFRGPDPDGLKPTDVNAGLVRELVKKYEKAGKHVEIIRHPLQDDYDAFDPLEAVLNDAAQRLRILERDNTQSAPAGSAELSTSKADTIAQEGVSLIGKVLSAGTPSSVFDRSMLDLVQLGRRVFFYDGTVSKRAALDPVNAQGVVPAEALKDLYSVHLAEAMGQVRGAYSPARDYGAIVGRDAQGNIELQTGKKIAATIQRQPITWTNAAGEQITIPGARHGAEFNRQVVRALREQKAAADGFIDAGLQQLPPQMEKAAKAIRGFYDTMLDLGDQAGLLPGQRSLAEARAKLEAAQEELNKVLDQRPPAAPPLDPKDATDAGTVEVFTNVPEQWRGVSLYDWGGKGLRTEGNRFIKVPGQRARKTFDHAWLRDLSRLYVGEPQVVRHLRLITSEVWPVNERRGKFWSTTHYLAPKEAIERARGNAARAAESRFEKALQAAEERVDKAQQRVNELQIFADRADHYFTRRWLAENVRNNKPGFTALLRRSWQKSRNIGIDPETGNLIEIADLDRPLIDEVRDRLGLGEQYRSEGDLFTAANDPDVGDPGLYIRYEQAVVDYFDDVAESTYRKITAPENRHGIETAYAGGSPFKKRILTVDESDAAAAEFLDSDPERILNSYFHTVGGRIATVTALKRARRLFGKAGEKLETPEDFLDLLQGRFQEVRQIAGNLDRTAGTNLTPKVQRHAHAAMLRFTRRIGQLQGQGLIDGSAGANALFEWGGRQLLGLNYLALLGSQTLSAVNDVAALTLFTEVTSIPRNVRYLVKALAPLKDAPARDLKLLRLAYEGEHARVLALGDVDFDDVGAGVGFGRTREITNRIGVTMETMQNAFNEINLINPWNRYVKRAGAMIAMDRLVTQSRKLARAKALIAAGASEADALARVKLTRRDAGRLAEYGINADTAARMVDLIRKYGTDEDGKALSSLTDAEWAGYKGLALPDARRWLESEGDSARELFDTYTAAINTEVERAMVITPGLTDKPLINDHWWGRALNQFQTFAMALANQVVRPMAQRPAGRQVATLLSYFAIGTVVDATRNAVAGRRSIDETAALWLDNPLGMTYSVVHTTGLSGWLNRPLAFADKIGVGPGAALGNTTISRSAFQGRTFWGSLSPVADLIDRTQYGVLGAFSPDGFQVQHAHALRKAVPFQNLIWFRLMTRLTGQDPLLTETLLRQKYGDDQQPRP